MGQLHRALRGIRWGWIRARSTIVLTWYRCLYPNLHVGRRVRLGRGVYLNVIVGGELRLCDDVVIDSFAHITAQGSICIGTNSYVGTGAIIVSAESITIGRDALIAAHVTIRDQDHRVNLASKPYNQQGLVASPVEIEDNVWVGTQATILRGVRIGEGAIIGAHALVRHSVEAGTMVGGVPAKMIKHIRRKSEL